MARRGHQKISGSRIWLLSIIFLFIATASVLFFQSRSVPFRAVPYLNPVDYYENSNSLRGNTYQLEGVIANALGSSQDKGRLFSLRIQSDGNVWPLPILVPPGYQILNIQRGQKYRIKVNVNDQGFLEIEDITKA